MRNSLINYHPQNKLMTNTLLATMKPGSPGAFATRALEGEVHVKSMRDRLMAANGWEVFNEGWWSTCS